MPGPQNLSAFHRTFHSEAKHSEVRPEKLLLQVSQPERNTVQQFGTPLTPLAADHRKRHAPAVGEESGSLAAQAALGGIGQRTVPGEHQGLTAVGFDPSGQSASQRLSLPAGELRAHLSRSQPQPGKGFQGGGIGNVQGRTPVGRGLHLPTQGQGPQVSTEKFGKSPGHAPPHQLSQLLFPAKKAPGQVQQNFAGGFLTKSKQLFLLRLNGQTDFRAFQGFGT